MLLTLKWFDFSTDTELYVKAHDKTICPLTGLNSQSTMWILYAKVTKLILLGGRQIIYLQW